MAGGVDGARHKFWRNPNGKFYAWYVIRNENGFYCNYNWFTNEVNSNSRRLVSRN